MTARPSFRLPRPRPLDYVWAALLGFLALLAPGTLYIDGAGSTVSTWAMFGWGLLYVLPLLWRRADPDLATLALLPAHLVQLAVVNAPNAGNITVPLMMFTVAAYGRLRYRLW